MLGLPWLQVANYHEVGLLIISGDLLLAGTLYEAIMEVGGGGREGAGTLAGHTIAAHYGTVNNGPLAFIGKQEVNELDQPCVVL